MAGKIHQYLAEDHTRLSDALERAVRDPERIDRRAFAEFREGLLRHIGMEEKTLLPAARTAQGGKPLTAAAQLRLDHSALAALLVPPPTLPIISAIRIILDHHNPLEEDSGGVYEQCERLVGRDADEILLRLRNTPPVAVAAHVDNLTATESARTALKRAGYKVEI